MKHIIKTEHSVQTHKLDAFLTTVTVLAMFFTVIVFSLISFAAVKLMQYFAI
ncbi:MAG: hypothetical protein Q8Q35_02590 [Nanoarchaeota archaeon]|nr:hypothetical protein [Nanoarchaeota archaeon]